MSTSMQTLNFLHLIHQKYKMSYSVMGKMLGVNRMSVYRRLNLSQISPAQEFRIKKAIAVWLSDFQKEFLSSYKKPL